MQAIYEFTPIIAAIISGHCPGTHAREEFVPACLRADWPEAKAMVVGNASGTLALDRLPGRPSQGVPGIAAGGGRCCSKAVGLRLRSVGSQISLLMILVCGISWYKS